MGVDGDASELELDGRAALEGEEAMEHGETVLAAREAEHHLVALLDHAVLSDGLAWEG